MITERRPDVSPFSAIESIANWLSGTFISQPLRSRIEWWLCKGSPERSPSENGRLLPDADTPMTC